LNDTLFLSKIILYSSCSSSSTNRFLISSKNLLFSSLTSLANHLKGDRTTIRQYLKGEKSGYYRGK
jgi:hypothetical protein